MIVDEEMFVKWSLPSKVRDMTSYLWITYIDDADIPLLSNINKNELNSFDNFVSKSDRREISVDQKYPIT